MKCIVILEVDTDVLIGTSCGGSHPPEEFDGTIEGLIESELGWVEQSGISVSEVLCPDNEIFSTPSQLGEIIKIKMSL